jgi:uncharacterized membrane protein YgcG
MTATSIYLNTITRKGITLITMGATMVMVLIFSLSVNFTSASAGAILAAPLCGNGSAPDYGFMYDLQQAHWTVGWQDYVSDKTVTEVDTILDKLNADSVAQTMILIQSQEQVGNRVNCAVHFLRYMQLGQPTGDRKDNGFAFLIVVEPTGIDVHYGVGLGLPALTAPELTSLNRAAEDAYQSTHSMDQAVLVLVQGFDTVARSKYAPLVSPTTSPGTSNPPSLNPEPLGFLSICGLLCMGIFFLLFLLWGFRQAARGGISFNPSGSTSRGMGNPFGGGRNNGGGGASSSPPTRGGSGSGRSRRGN